MVFDFHFKCPLKYDVFVSKLGGLELLQRSFPRKINFISNSSESK